MSYYNLLVQDFTDDDEILNFIQCIYCCTGASSYINVLVVKIYTKTVNRFKRFSPCKIYRGNMESKVAAKK